MSTRPDRLARRLWAGELGVAGAVLSALLAPASWLWLAVASARARRYDRLGGATVEGLTVISVGNLAVGGTGKTPVASWVARACAEVGRRPAVLLSGYGRDETLLHGRWTPGIPAFADRDRIAAARRARAAGADVAVLDDGFQHRRLARALDIVLLAVEDRFPGPVLPRGPYREGPEALARASAVVITRRDGDVEAARSLARRASDLGAPVRGALRMAPGAWTELDGAPADRPSGDVLLVTAVARPQSVVRAVEGLVPGSVEPMPFRDHHDFDDADVGRIVQQARGRPIVCTEKDAVKLAGHSALAEMVTVLGQELRWDWGEEEVRGLVTATAEALP